MAPREAIGLLRSGNAQLSAMRVADPEKWRNKVITAIRLNHGIILNAAIALGIHRNTLQRWVNKHPELRQVVQQAQAQ